MSPLVALCVSIGIGGGLLAVIGVLLGLPGWAAFIAWGCYVQAGADTNALKKTIAGNIFGAICGWLAVFLMVSVPVDGNLWILRAFVAVALTLIIVVLGSRAQALSLIPASIYGYAAEFGFLYQSPEARTPEVLTHIGRTNGLLSIILAMVLGAIFGMLAGMVGKKNN